MWLYSERTAFFSSSVTELAICVLWTLGYQLTSPDESTGDPLMTTGDFLTLLSNLGFFSGSLTRLTNLLCGYSGLLRTSFQAEEVADLLNVGLWRQIWPRPRPFRGQLSRQSERHAGQCRE